MSRISIDSKNIYLLVDLSISILGMTISYFLVDLSIKFWLMTIIEFSIDISISILDNDDHLLSY